MPEPTSPLYYFMHLQKEKPAPAGNGEPAGATEAGEASAIAEGQLEPPPYTGGSWPRPLGPEAFPGLPGEVIRTIEPHTEADPAALLSTFLVAFGNCITRAPHFYIEDTRHGANENVIITGPTGSGRKGTGMDRVMGFFAEADAHWFHQCQVAGLTSGEGIIHRIRDPRDEDAGVTDKRLVVAETEFAQALSAAGRRENTLSPMIRQCWDGKPLSTLAKNQGKGPEVASNPHVSIIGHITAEELRQKLGATDASNGFLNRFLLVASKRSKELPFGGTLRASDCPELVARLRMAIEWARGCGEIGMTDAAAARWEMVYGDLTAGRPGILGGVVSRAAPHVRRLAMIYALLDKAPAVDLPHLEAAIEVWRYCEDTAKMIFGGLSKGAVHVYDCLRDRWPNAVAKSDIHREVFRGHQSKASLDDIRDELLRAGMLRIERVTTGGAPKELWSAKHPDQQ